MADQKTIPPKRFIGLDVHKYYLTCARSECARAECGSACAPE